MRRFLSVLAVFGIALGALAFNAAPTHAQVYAGGYSTGCGTYVLTNAVGAGAIVTFPDGSSIILGPNGGWAGEIFSFGCGAGLNTGVYGSYNNYATVYSLPYTSVYTGALTSGIWGYGISGCGYGCGSYGLGGYQGGCLQFCGGGANCFAVGCRGGFNGGNRGGQGGQGGGDNHGGDGHGQGGGQGGQGGGGQGGNGHNGHGH